MMTKKRALWVRDAGLVDMSGVGRYMSAPCRQVATAADGLPIVALEGRIVYDEGEAAAAPWRHGEPCYCLDDEDDAAGAEVQP